MSELYWLLCGHFLGDYVFQSDWVAINKSRHTNKTPVHWGYVLTSHAVVHGVMVSLVTQNIWFGIAETVAHFVIDFGKCENWYGIHVDQGLHGLCKIIWWIL